MWKRAHAALSPGQVRAWKRRHHWRRWLSFLWLENCFGLKLDEPEGVHYAVVDLNAWTFSGSNNIWASILLALFEVLESECGDWALRTGLADLEAAGVGASGDDGDGNGDGGRGRLPQRDTQDVSDAPRV